ncbi:MAG: HEAT repeat domain-containing protein [Oligoflexus sp.]|nr:HEAT repeat domain-containing protein [Oligoflexus sp.]
MIAKNKIAIALGLSGVLAATAYVLQSNNFFTAKSKLPAETVEIKNPTEYEFVLRTTIQDQNQPERDMLSFRGVLVQAEQAPGEYQTQWSSIESLKLNDMPMPVERLESILSIPTLSKKEGNAYVHYLAPEFPDDFASMQHSFLYKFFPSMNLKGASPQLQMETDEIGNVNVSYEIVPSGDLFAVKRLYVQSVSDHSRYDGKKNSIQYSFLSDGRLKSANGEVAVYLTAGSIITSHVSIQMKDTKIAFTKANKLFTSAMRIASPRKPGAQLIPGTTIEGLKTLDEVFANVDKLKGDELRSEYNEMLKNVVYDLYYNPGNLPKVVAKVKSITERDDDSRLKVTMLMASIAGTDTHAGAEALADLAKTGCEDEYCKEQAATGSIMHGNPSVKSATTMLEIAEGSTSEDVSSAAYLAAGAAGSKLGTELPQLPSALTDALSKHPDGNLHRSVILAMGNHGDASYFNPLRTTLQSKDGFDRGAAIFAMRNLPNPEVNSIIMDTFAKDSDRSVVLDSVRAMHARNFESADFMEIAKVGLKANQEVQEATVNLLLDQYMYNKSDASEAINTMREKSQVADVKALIDEGLARLQNDGKEESEPSE